VKVLDLFSGMGGLASGFKAAGFQVTGVDRSELAGQTFELNGFGRFVQKDLLMENMTGNYEILIGGPPCRPWSSVNTIKREKRHLDYRLLGVYFKHVLALRPRPLAFVFENVPPAGHSGTFEYWSRKAERAGYSILKTNIKYSEFGADTRRQRFFAVGVLNDQSSRVKEALDKRRSPESTVKSKIWDLRNTERGQKSYHEWPRLNTIEKYLPLYNSGKYGWYKLKWGEPAPSFGNIMKTYILHPDSLQPKRKNCNLKEKDRVISVREAFLIMGFSEGLRFPERAGLAAKYQMIADSVSPVFSRKLAEAIKEVLQP
jgi:DNA (cytosine-5)-methyltransferase 1